MPGTARVAVKTTDSGIITINLQDITGRDSGDQVAREIQKIARLAQYADAARVSLRARIINQLREEGLDHSGRFAWILGSDAVRTANQVVQPLAAIAAEADNVYRNARVFETRLQTLVWDPIKLARESRGKGTTLGLDV